MADITSQLTTIKDEQYGEPVLSAISSALTTVKGSANIASELYTITNGRYGSDIRMAIHDALYKVSQSGGGGDSSNGIELAYGNDPFIDISVIGNATKNVVITRGETIGCIEDYFFDGIVTCVVAGRGYETSTREERIGMTVYLTSGFSAPLFISRSETGVAYSYNPYPLGSVTYDGATWYYSDTQWAMGGNNTDSTGTLLQYPDAITYGDPNDILSILEYVKAVAIY